jgi:hypothetical protein
VFAEQALVSLTAWHDKNEGSYVAATQKHATAHIEALCTGS